MERLFAERKYATFLILSALFVIAISWKSQPVTIFLIGDSTMADKPIDGNPERGWGMVLPSYFTDKVVVENHARNGRSSRTFIEEGRWDYVLSRVHEGDYVVIQFGHNDEGEMKKAYTRPADLKANFERMANDVLARKAIPVFCTPIARRKFDTVSHELVDTHPAIYPETIRSVAKEKNVALIDMQRKTEVVLRAYGPEKSAALFLHFGPGIWNLAPNGRSDDTHLSEAGGLAMAQCFVEGLRELNIRPLVKELVKGDVTLKLTTPVPGIDDVKPVK